MHVAIGSDHGGYQLKQTIKSLLDSMKISYEDVGCHSLDSLITQIMHFPWQNAL